MDILSFSYLVNVVQGRLVAMISCGDYIKPKNIPAIIISPESDFVKHMYTLLMKINFLK